MRILILGGTMFVGRALAEVALERGHQLTLFTRGRHNNDLFPQAEHLHGDRDGNLDALRGGKWDAVIDTSGYLPRVVRQSAQLLSSEAPHYTFISTISVYADSGTPGNTEESPLATLDDPAIEEITGETYGPLKVLCERAVEEVFPGHNLIVRPGFIVGPNDPTDRFTYWVRRAAAGGPMLAPGKPESPIQFIDARDLAEWTMRMVEKGATGIYNATGPAQPLPMRTFLETARDVSRSDAELVWIDEDFLERQGVQSGADLPLWVPDDDETGGFHRYDVSKAIQAGLTFRPLETTIHDTLEWQAANPVGDRPAGLKRSRESSLLRAWAARSTT